MKTISYFIIAVVIFFSCAPSSQSDGESAEEISSVNQEYIDESTIIENRPEPDKQYKIGVLFPMLASPFWVNESYGILSEAEELGVEVIWYSADGYTNVDKQNSQIDDLISLGVDGIVVGPTSFAGNSPAIERAISKGIKVVTHVTGSSAEGIISNVLADDVNIGQKQAKFLKSRLEEGSEIIMLAGPAGADWSMNRLKGFKSFIQDSTNFSIVAERFGEPDRSTSQRLIEELLVAFPDVDAIYTAADGMAIGVATVIENSKFENQPLLTTASFSKETIPYIQKEKISINVDESPVLQGQVAIRTLIYALNGYGVPNTILVPTPEITIGNIDNIEVKGRWAPDEYFPK